MRILVLTTVMLSLSSCITMSLLSESAHTDTVSREKTTLHLDVFQTLSSRTALASTNSWDVVLFYTRDIQLYDGKKITTRCQLVDTYSYKSKEDLYKTVPVFMPISEYGKYGYTKGDVYSY